MNKNIKKLRILSAGLCLSAALLTGCDDKEKFCPSEINYEDENPVGKIKYEDLSNCGRIVTIEHNEMKIHLLLIKEKNISCGIIEPEFEEFIYYDLKTGVKIIRYKHYCGTDITSWIVGEDLNIIDDQDITGYLLESNFIKKEYEVDEVLKFFEENILPTLKNEEKEMIK